MNTETPPETIPVPLASVVAVAVEHWRLATSLAGLPGGGPAAARHAARRMGDFLRECGVEAAGMDGTPYEPGLAVRVIDTVEDPAAPAGQAVIEETLSPVVTWRGQVVRAAEVVTRRGEPVSLHSATALSPFASGSTETSRPPSMEIGAPWTPGPSWSTGAAGGAGVRVINATPAMPVAAAASADAMAGRVRMVLLLVPGVVPGSRASRAGAVGRHENARKTIEHPQVGPIELDCDILTVEGTGLHVMIYTAQPGTVHADNLARTTATGTQAAFTG